MGQWGRSAMDETKEVGLGEQRQRRSVGRLPGFLAGMAYGLSGVPAGVGAEIQQRVEGERRGMVEETDRK